MAQGVHRQRATMGAGSLQMGLADYLLRNDTKLNVGASELKYIHSHIAWRLS